MLYQALPADTYSDKTEYAGGENEDTVSTSSAESDYTGSDYNLGRIIGPSPIYNNLTLYWPEKSFVLMDLFHAQTGIDDQFSFGGYGLGVLGTYKDENALWMYMFPEFDFNCAAGPSNRFRVVLMPSNLLFMAQGGRTESGFDRSFSMYNMYQWDFLSRDGEIRVSADQLDNSFYCRPLLNAGQVGINMSVAHFLGDSDATNYGVARSHISVGLFNNLQLDFDAHYNSTTYTFHSSDYITYVYGSDYFGLGSKIHFRYGNLAVNGGYSLIGNLGKTSGKMRSISVDGSYIKGNCIGSVTEVEGNWDDFFTAQMGEHQLYATMGLDFNIPTFNNAQKYFELSNSLKYGLSSVLTIGENISLSGYDGTTNVNLELTALLSNIPHREYGPSEASKFEYIFGLWPEEGQVLLDLSYRLPFKKDTYFYQYQSTGYQTYSSLLRLINHTENPEFSTSQLRVPFDNSSADVVLADRDLHLKIMVGVARKVTLANVFEFRIDQHSGYYYRTDMNGNIIDFIDGHGDKNFVYANKFLTAIGDPKRILTVLSCQIFGQSDDRVNGKDKFDFILGCDIMSAF
jgi:hypothetical protein